MKQLTCYAHPAPDQPQHCPYSPNPITYGKDNQAPTEERPLLDNAGKKRIQQVIGSFLYYARAINPSILLALSDIATQQAAPTQNTKKQVDQFLDYMWTHPDAKICYRASDMILTYILMPHISLPRVPVAMLALTSSLAACQSTVIQSNSTAPFISHALS